MAALAAIVDHDHARALNELLQEGIQLRQQLERQRRQLEQQGQQLEQQRIQMRRQELRISTLKVTIAWAHHDVQMGEIETAEQRLMGHFGDIAWADDDVQMGYMEPEERLGHFEDDADYAAQ